jgi:hypothetical protein
MSIETPERDRSGQLQLMQAVCRKLRAAIERGDGSVSLLMDLDSIQRDIAEFLNGLTEV